MVNSNSIPTVFGQFADKLSSNIVEDSKIKGVASMQHSQRHDIQISDVYCPREWLACVLHIVSQMLLGLTRK